ncbi:hypothetical protein KIN20_000910 [Parelaphostrongylus tenuis]|uniref:Amino acid transporter transmembrane domain-containing protein n=1 Tax=Parelaphostrongylus tenuis TaxID=148309 RepID=A0AAD5MLF6_PARTN|nr:hypothetical protein KIN20_000910 [Parelaphostrongylus tenuis]
MIDETTTTRKEHVTISYSKAFTIHPVLFLSLLIFSTKKDSICLMHNIKIADFNVEPQAAKSQQGIVVASRKKGISAHLALINLLKGLIGPGCFSLPLAFRASGVWAGFILVFAIGVLTCLCMLKIVRCSQFLTSRNPNVQALDYADMADESFKQSFPFLRKYGHIARLFVTVCVSSLVLGVCAIYYIFVVDHTREVLTYIWPDFSMSKFLCLVLAIVPFLLLSYVRSVVLMSYISMLGNVFMLLSAAIIFTQLFLAEHVYDSVPAVTDFRGVVFAAGSVIYSFEGQALVLPLENKMKHPIEMRGWTGVLSAGISLIICKNHQLRHEGGITYDYPLARFNPELVGCN